MDSLAITKYREVPLLKQSIELNRKTIDVTCGGYPTMLVDSKTFELSGGFVFDGTYAGRQHGARFIYWHTLRETVYFTETCLHRNDFWHEVKITFKGTPILSVGIHSHGSKNFFILIATTTSFHRIPIKRPSSADSNLIVEQDSVLSKLNEHIITDPMNCYTFINDIGQSPPMAASAMHCPGKNYSSFAIATGKSLHLCTMGLGGDKPEVKFVNLECHTSLTDHMGSAWITNRTHSVEVVTMCFIPTCVPDDQPLLFTLHRDGALRVWLPSGQLLTTDYLYKYTKGSKTDFHSCVSRGSKMLIGLFVSFKTFSEFVILRPTVTFDRQAISISSLTWQNVCSINAPKLDLIDFQLCDLSLWSLWCNSTNEMQTLVHEMASQAKLGTTNWQPVIMTSALDDDLPENADGIDLREYYCKRIFNSGLFQLITIKKTCMMLKDNVTGREGSPVIGSMSRLKRDVSACIKAQLRKEQAIMERNGACDNEQLLELSNQLWEKFYRYCVQHSNKSSRPIGLFLCEEMVNETQHLTVGLVRKQFVSFFRTCDRLEAAYYSEEPQAVDETTDATSLLVKYLKVTEESLTQEQKQELDNFVYQQQIVATEPRLEIDLAAEFEMEADSETDANGDLEDLPAVHTDDISLLSVAISIAHSQNNFIAFEVMRNFGANRIDLVNAICSFLRFVTPEKRKSEPSKEEGHEGYVSVHTGHHLYSELALATTKQTIEFRYMLLRNLLLLQYLIRSLQSELRNETINKLLIRLQPRIEMLVRCYHVMNWMANSRLELDWSRKRRSEIIATFPSNQRNTPLTLLQAYTRCRLSYKPPRQLAPSHTTLDDPLDDIGDCYALSLIQKADAILAHLSPFHDDFRFGEWLSANELSLHIDDYVELVGKWCAVNKNSRTFIRAKSCLLDGDTFKALDLFLKAQEGVHKERFLLMFLRYYPNGEQRSLSPYEISSTYFLQVIRLFELYGAHDAVPKLVTVALKHTLNPGQQAMFQNIEFSSHMALGRYEKAYKSLSSNVDPARRKDCLRQMVSLLLSTQRLDMLMKLPSRGQLLEFTEIVAMNARSADNEDMFRYYFLYAFYADRLFMRDAADIAFEEAIRYITDNTTRDQLQRYCNALLRCISCLATVPTWRAWVARPAIANISQGQDHSNENKLEVLDLKKLQERLTIGHSVLSLSKNTDDSKLLTSLKPKELVQLLMRRKKYNLALQLAHCSVPSMVPTVYGNLAKSCVFISSSQSDAGSIDTDESEAGSNGETGLAWLHENCLSDVPVGVDSASTAWNYLRYMINSEPDELITDAYLAVLGSVIACGAHVPLWLRAWCFEHSPVQLVRAYWSHGLLEEAYECMVELFKIRLFTPGRFTHHAAFPLTLYERIFYDLEQSPNYTKATLDKYLSLIEINV
uniref:Nuclear pore complex protein Nup160 n=1 Tax=Anopheles atroparvus TaxID=41427 RepID=A0A182IZW8_ANOAO